MVLVMGDIVGDMSPDAPAFKIGGSSNAFRGRLTNAFRIAAWEGKTLAYVQRSLNRPDAVVWRQDDVPVPAPAMPAPPDDAPRYTFINDPATIMLKGDILCDPAISPNDPAFRIDRSANGCTSFLQKQTDGVEIGWNNGWDRGFSLGQARKDLRNGAILLRLIAAPVAAAPDRLAMAYVCIDDGATELREGDLLWYLGQGGPHLHTHTMGPMEQWMGGEVNGTLAPARLFGTSLSLIRLTYDIPGALIWRPAAPGYRNARAAYRGPRAARPPVPAGPEWSNVTSVIGDTVLQHGDLVVRPGYDPNLPILTCPFYPQLGSPEYGGLVIRGYETDPRYNTLSKIMKASGVADLSVWRRNAGFAPGGMAAANPPVERYRGGFKLPIVRRRPTTGNPHYAKPLPIP